MDQKIRPAAPAPPNANQQLTPAAKVYRIARERNGRLRCFVGYLRNDRPVQVRNLRHIEKHSPTVFECGYAGSGPADLALSILTDFFFGGSGKGDSLELGDVAAVLMPEPVREAIHRAEAVYQDFKRAFIAPLTVEVGQCVDIKASAIARWISEHGEQQALGIPTPPPTAVHRDLG